MASCHRLLAKNVCGLCRQRPHSRRQSGSQSCGPEMWYCSPSIQSCTSRCCHAGDVRFSWLQGFGGRSWWSSTCSVVMFLATKSVISVSTMLVGTRTNAAHSVDVALWIGTNGELMCAVAAMTDVSDYFQVLCCDCLLRSFLLPSPGDPIGVAVNGSDGFSQLRGSGTEFRAT